MEVTKMFTIKDLTDEVLNQELEDDSTKFGGIAYYRETLREFIEDANLNENATLKELDEVLKKCGIKPLKLKQLN